jgi:outer membrane protein assembly factor BamE (lipoprotein component of BamABCDE complex)
MSVFSIRTATVTALGLATLATGACAPLRSHQGYVIDSDLVNSVQPGVDNRQSVLQTLGKPSFASQFNQGDWYYIARDSRNYGFSSPHVRDQITLQIVFDKAGTVSAVRRGNIDQVASINPTGKTTPTLGRKRGFFSDLFGNIGTVGAPGTGSARGGGRDQP